MVLDYRRAWDLVIISFFGSHHHGWGIVVGIVVGDMEKRAPDFGPITGNLFFQSFRKSQQLKKVWFELGSTGLLPCLNPEPDLWSGSAQPSNLGPNFGPVLKSSGSNFGSEPDCGIPTLLTLIQVVVYILMM
jgi:hypothetical protein